MSVINLDTFKHLLPKARAWSITAEKQLRQFFVGLVSTFSDAQSYQDDTWFDFRPQETTKLSQWEDQFGLLPAGLTEQERRDRLEATWKALGGQSPRYLQDTVQDAGFPLFIHEWVNPAGLPSRVPWNPNAWIAPDAAGGYVLTQLGKPSSQLGRASTQLGKARALSYLITDNLPDPPTWPMTDTTKWPYFLYFGDATFGDVVQIPAEREVELRTLLLKICPAQQWLGMFVEFV